MLESRPYLTSWPIPVMPWWRMCPGLPVTVVMGVCTWRKGRLLSLIQIYSIDTGDPAIFIPILFQSRFITQILAPTLTEKFCQRNENLTQIIDTLQKYALKIWQQSRNKDFFSLLTNDPNVFSPKMNNPNSFTSQVLCLPIYKWLESEKAPETAKYLNYSNQIGMFVSD